MIEQSNTVLSIRSDLLTHSLRKVVLYTPCEEPKELPARSVRGRIQVTVPKLMLWEILSLE